MSRERSRRRSLRIALLLVALLAAAPSQAATLASWTLLYSTSTLTQVESTLSLGPTNDPINDPGHIFLGDGIAIFSISDAPGTSFTVTEADDADFAAFEASLTDGLPPAPEWFGWVARRIPGPGGSFGITQGAECGLIIAIGGSCVGAVDLEGHDIESVVFTLLDVGPFPDSQSTGLFTDIEIRIEGSATAAVPEPTAALCFALGFVVIGAAQHRRRAAAH